MLVPFLSSYLTNVGSIGFKQDYQNSYEVRFWIKRFMALALIPLYRIEDAVAIIINEIDPDEEIFDKKVEFLQYFVKQWLNAKMSKQGPEIWSQHLATIRTNNASESNHSIQSSIIPRHHGLVSEIISYFKHSDSKSSDKFLKLQNNFTSSQSRSSRTQKDFQEFT